MPTLLRLAPRALLFGALACQKTPTSPTAETGTEPTGAPTGDSGATTTPDPALHLETPPLELASGEERIACAAFTTPNDAELAVRAWSSTASAGVVRFAVAFTPTAVAGDGWSADCSLTGGASWVYTSTSATDGWSFPADDGAGSPVGKVIPTGQTGYLLVHAVNATAEPLAISATVDAQGYPEGTAVTRAEPYLTYDTNINVAPLASGASTVECPTPPGARFSWLTTISHRLTTRTEVRDAAATWFEGTDWEDPGALEIAQAPFAAFAGDAATVTCEYTNPTNAAVHTGDSAADELCVMMGYHFPAAAPRQCVNGVLLP